MVWNDLSFPFTFLVLLLFLVLFLVLLLFLVLFLVLLLFRSVSVDIIRYRSICLFLRLLAARIASMPLPYQGKRLKKQFFPLAANYREFRKFQDIPNKQGEH